MSRFKELYRSDMCRFGTMRKDAYCRKFSYYLRKTSTSKNKLLRLYYRFRYRIICNQHGNEIPSSTKIGKGFYMGHPYNITINSKAVLGDNVNVHKGVTIGQENRGPRRGVPTIKDRVWIGVNATVVGNITIGEDVLIAPNSYVNCDVPDHCVVVGNPCKIIPRENATENYVCYLAE